nr:MAG TPA: hypothetical protein [Caudoviricetes sp.]
MNSTVHHHRFLISDYSLHCRPNLMKVYAMQNDIFDAICAGITGTENVVERVL